MEYMGQLFLLEGIPTPDKGKEKWAHVWLELTLENVNQMAKPSISAANHVQSVGLAAREGATKGGRFLAKPKVRILRITFEQLRIGGSAFCWKLTTSALTMISS